MIKGKNYYEILNVTPDSSINEIKASFRKLARKYHPDLNPDGALLFKEISEAYETLSNTAKRNQYDIINGFFKSEKQTTSDKNNSHFDNSFKKENFTKKKTDNSYDKREFSKKINEIFDEFKKNSSKKYSKDSEKVTPICGTDIYADILINISESVKGTSRTVNIVHSELCPLCRGRKFINGAKCSSCSGKGEISQYRKLTVKIPKGVKNGTKLRIPDEGNAGKFGGKNGDLYLNIKIENSSRMKYEGLNVLYNLPLTPFEAVLGTEITIPAFEGDVLLKIPPKTNSGQKFRLSGQGLAEKEKIGDMIITVHIEIPSSLSDDEIKLYEKLKKLSRSNIRENLFNE